jgi:Flp pilus assembly protein TadD
MPHAVLAILAVAILASSGALASENATNREIARTFAHHHLSLKDYAAAVAILREHLSEDARDWGAWNLLGLSYLKAGHPQHATTAFQAAADTATGEEKAALLYNLADAKVRSGDLAGARSSLKMVSEDARYGDGAKRALSSLSPGIALPSLSEAMSDRDFR